MDGQMEDVVVKTGGLAPAELEQLASCINSAHRGARTSAHTAVGHALRCGELLLEVKAGLAHGEWLPWLAANVKFSQQTASAYMRVATGKRKLPATSNLSLGNTLKLLAEPKEPKPKKAPKETPAEEEDESSKPTGKRRKKWKPDPLFGAIGETIKLARAEPATKVIADMKAQYDGGQGFDVGFKEELVRLRDWLNAVIEGVEPFIVTCEINRSSDKGVAKPDDDEDDDPGIEANVDPKNYRAAYLLRVDAARRFAAYSGPVTEEIVAAARVVAADWSRLAKQLEGLS
jgi:hypothetical protein